MIFITINSNTFLVSKTLSVLEACKYLGLIIPRFCYHETLSIAGNCRMCLIELENSPKPIAACALPVSINMQIFLNTPLVKKARENILEAILINHPLDCPICDQAGECDLQDQTIEYGVNNFSRFYYKKKNVEDKNFNFLIKTVMTRCIHCTRCVRFTQEVTGTNELGTLNRGNSMEIGNYTSGILLTLSELSGNVVDLCPVGALTSKSYAFKARPWELKTAESIDITDSFGSNIYIQYKETTTLRIIPKINKELNDSFITDKARFFFDSLFTQRLYKSFIKNLGNFIQLEDSKLLLQLLSFFKSPTKLLIIINAELDLYALFLLKALSFKYKYLLSIKTIYKLSNSLNYLKTNKVSNTSDFKKSTYNIICLISLNLKVESALLNSKLRLKFLNEHTKIYCTATFYKLNYKVHFINLQTEKLIKIVEGKLPHISRQILKATKVLCFFGEAILKRGISSEFLENHLIQYIPKLSIIRVHGHCNTEGLKYNNILNYNKQSLILAQTIFAFNLDSTTFIYKQLYEKGKNFCTFKKLNNFKRAHFTLVWFNTHGSNLANFAQIIVPVAAYTEEESIYVNMDGRPQKALKLSLLSNEVYALKNFVSLFLSIQKKKQKKIEKCYNFYQNLLRDSSILLPLNTFKFSFYNKSTSIILNYPTKPNISDFYLSTKLCKHSKILSKCSQNYKKSIYNF